MLQIWPENREIDLVSAYAQDIDIDNGFLRINMVSSLDGAISFDGRAKELSSEIDQKCFQTMRSLADVILVGANTAKVENYKPADFDGEIRSQRVARGQLPQPRIAIVSKSLDFNWKSELFSSDTNRPIILTTESSAQSLTVPDYRAEVICTGDSKVNLKLVKKELVARGLSHILCEGGPTLNASLMESGLIDELCLTITPKVLQGSGIRIFNGPSLPMPEQFSYSHIYLEDGQLFTRNKAL